MVVTDELTIGSMLVTLQYSLDELNKNFNNLETNISLILGVAAGLNLVALIFFYIFISRKLEKFKKENSAIIVRRMQELNLIEDGERQ